MVAVFRAQYVYEAQQEDELNLQAGDQVHVLNNDNESWWTVENVETGKKGLVPSNFLQQISSTNESGSKMSSEAPILAKVINEYKPQNSDELALWVNGIVTILDQSIGDGWWKGDLNGKVGVFPSNHVKLVDATEQLESSDTANTSGDSKSTKSPFKLAAYGVKQGGIGSILAGGMNLRKKSGGSNNRTSIAEEDHSGGPSPTEQKPSTSSDNKFNNTSESTLHKKGMVIHDYDPEKSDELKLLRGEHVTITDTMGDEGWWTGINEAGQSGVFPSNFVQVLEEQHPPPRRARPPTIKTETTQPSSNNNSENPLSPNSMAKPPPVPVSTRPTTLISNRSSESSSSTSHTPAPPARPVTSPPLPTRRPNSNVGTSGVPEPPKRTHKPRQPSIPLVAPDLPPITSKSIERPQSNINNESPIAPSRPSRHVPTPTGGDGAISPPRRSSTVERRSIDGDHNRPPIPMAKPPKMFGTKQHGAVVPPPRTSSGSRPSSQAVPPSVPGIVPSPRQLSISGESSLMDPQQKDTTSPLSPPPMPKRSMPMPPPSSTSSSSSISTSTRNKKNENILLEEEEEDNSTLDPKIVHLLQREIGKIRHEFEALLEIERKERQRLENEIQELKQSQ
ncbi:hypothetical protein INT45_003875 [Circinella minor]|uniref:SH3 domain-containing protein n=1 Tax=Circinella minor TaxID=1195481 RepID=A0A8H7SEJ8_9FUNG|nr:hypothetical protein INT45_003875 [Circinella minor]